MGRTQSLIFIVALLCSAFAWNGEANAQTSMNLNSVQDYYHDWLDGSYDIATQDGYAYLACGQEGVHVLDISVLSDMRDVARITNIHAKTLVVSGQKLYLGSDHEGIYVFDISDPKHPVEENSIQTPGRTFNCLRVQGPYLCVCGVDSSGAGLSFVQIEIGSAFSAVWSSQTIVSASDIQIQDQVAYVGTGTKLLMLNVADITSPQAVDSMLYGYGEDVLGVAVSGNYAYLANADAGFRIVNLTNHQQVAQLLDLDPNVFTDFDYPMDVRLVGNMAYVHYNIGDCPLAIIDVSDPAQPVIESNYYPPDNISKFSMDGNIAFIADLTGGLRVLDVSDGYHPLAAYKFDDYDRDQKIAGMVGDIAYIQQVHRVVAMDLSEPREPRERGTIGWDMSPASPYWAGEIHHFELSGTVGYCQFGFRLYTLDLSDPDRITVLDSIDGQYDDRFVRSDPYIYMLTDSGMMVVNASNPRHLVHEGYIPTVGYSLADDGYLFHFTQEGTMLCACEDIASPQWLGPYPRVLQYSPDQAAKIVGDRLYLAAWNAVVIYSLSDTSQHSMFKVVEPDDWSQWITDLDVEDGIAYVTVSGNNGGGVEMYDIRNPQAVERIAYNESPVRANSLLVRGSLVYVAAESHLATYEFTGGLTNKSMRESKPQVCALEPNYPNPFNPTTTIAFDLPASGQMSLSIFNTLGQKVATLAEGYRAAGHYQVKWDGSNAASGVYFYRLQNGETVLNRKMTLVR